MNARLPSSSSSSSFPSSSHNHTDIQTHTPPPTRNTHTPKHTSRGLPPATLKGGRALGKTAILEASVLAYLRQNPADSVRQIAGNLAHPETTIRRVISSGIERGIFLKLSNGLVSVVDSGAVPSRARANSTVKRDLRSLNADSDSSLFRPGNAREKMARQNVGEVDKMDRDADVRQLLDDFSGKLRGPVPFVKMVGEQLTDALSHYSVDQLREAFFRAIEGNNGRWMHSQAVLADITLDLPDSGDSGQNLPSWSVWYEAGLSGKPSPTSNPVEYSAWKVGRARALGVSVNRVNRDGTAEPDRMEPSPCERAEAELRKSGRPLFGYMGSPSA